MTTEDTINHGYCIVILGNGFLYVGELITDSKFIVIKEPANIREYRSGKGLLWHAANGAVDTILDPYPNGELKAPFNKLEHFIPTKRALWT